MDEKSLPENVRPHKAVKPKGWSYPLKTTELVELLQLADLGEPVEIWYDNSPHRPFRLGKKGRPPGSTDRPDFPIFDVMRYGKGEAEGWMPHFSIHVRLVKPEYRLRLADFLKKEVLPQVAAWMQTFKKLKTWHALDCDYDSRYQTTGERRQYTAIVLTQDGFSLGRHYDAKKRKEILVKELNLESEDGSEVS